MCNNASSAIVHLNKSLVPSSLISSMLLHSFPDMTCFFHQLHVWLMQTWNNILYPILLLFPSFLLKSRGTWHTTATRVNSRLIFLFGECHIMQLPRLARPPSSLCSDRSEWPQSQREALASGHALQWRKGCSHVHSSSIQLRSLRKWKWNYGPLKS